MKNIIKVVPSILTDDRNVLEKMVGQAEKFAQYVQFDIMDGLFVPSNSISAREISVLNLRFEWEAHLMVRQPLVYIQGFAEAGAKKIVFHFEAGDPPKIVIEKIKNAGTKIGLAVNPETKVSDFAPLIDKVHSVLLLSVQPGFYGSKFIPEVLEKVSELRNLNKNVEIGIDGGIKENNVSVVARSGIDAIFVGSGIFHTPDPAASYKRLIALTQKALSVASAE